MADSEQKPKEEAQGSAPASPAVPDSESTDVTKLKTALQAQREEAKAARRERDELAGKVKAAEDAAKALEEKALTEQGEWRTLAEQRQSELNAATGRLADAEAKGARVTALEQTLSALADQQVAALGLDDPTVELLSGLSPEHKLDWIVKHRETLAKRNGVRIPGTTPESALPGKLSDAERAARFAQITARLP